METRDWDWVIPLVGGGRAILRTPIPLTEENYEILTENLARTLREVKKAIVWIPQKDSVANDS